MGHRPIPKSLCSDRATREWLANPLSGQPRWISVGRYKVCKVPLGTDPIEAVKLCRKHGLICDVIGVHPSEHEIPMVIPSAVLVEHSSSGPRQVRNQGIAGRDDDQ